MNILVDSSVWIDYLRRKDSPARALLIAGMKARTLATTDVVVMEVLAGPTSEEIATRYSRLLAGCDFLPQSSPDDAEHAARLFRACRRAGETPRSLIDCIVAAIAIRNELPVLHRDRDFAVLARHTSLQLVSP